MSTPTGAHLFHPDYGEPLNTRTQVDRLPPVDAPCMCDGRSPLGIKSQGPCLWPFCPYPQPPEKEDE